MCIIQVDSSVLKRVANKVPDKGEWFHVRMRAVIADSVGDPVDEPSHI